MVDGRFLITPPPSKHYMTPPTLCNYSDFSGLGFPVCLISSEIQFQLGFILFNNFAMGYDYVYLE